MLVGVEPVATAWILMSAAVVPAAMGALYPTSAPSGLTDAMGRAVAATPLSDVEMSSASAIPVVQTANLPTPLLVSIPWLMMSVLLIQPMAPADARSMKLKLSAV